MTFQSGRPPPQTQTKAAPKIPGKKLKSQGGEGFSVFIIIKPINPEGRQTMAKTEWKSQITYKSTHPSQNLKGFLVLQFYEYSLQPQVFSPYNNQVVEGGGADKQTDM